MSGIKIGRIVVATALAFSTGASVGCGGDIGSDEVGQTQDALYVLSSRLWTSRDIPVCWSFGGSTTEKTWVKEVLEGQHSWEAAANVDFTGWGSCGASPTGIVIDLKPFAAQAGVGMPLSGPQTVSLDFGPLVQGWYTACSSHDLTRDKCIKTVALHEFGHALGFAHEQNRLDNPTTCDQEAQGSDGDSEFGPWDARTIMNYCNTEPELSGIDRRGAERFYGSPYRDAPRLHDYNGDGRADLQCHDVLSGDGFVDYADSAAHYDTTNFHRSAYCSNNASRLFVGDFNNDHREDLLCINTITGARSIDYASTTGAFDGIDWSSTTPFCSGTDTRRLYIGDFNGDGRSDLLCHDFADGHLWIDYASTTGTFGASDWERATDGFCWGDGKFGLHGRIFIGKFDSDNRDDILCHELTTGQKWFDYADASGHFMGTDASSASGFCNGSTSELHVADFDGDGLTDLLCSNVDTGYKEIDFGNDGYAGTDWERDARWCGYHNNSSRLFTGDVNRDGHADLFCLDIVTGKKWIDYWWPGENFIGTDWSLDNGWCSYESTELH